MPKIYTEITTPTMEKVATAIKDLNETNMEQYKVTWSSEQWDPEAEYTVEEISFCRGGRMKIRIKGPKSGDWQIDSNFSGLEPKISNIRDNGYEQKSKLIQLTITGE